jgi:hypothetical protein
MKIIEFDLVGLEAAGRVRGGLVHRILDAVPMEDVDIGQQLADVVAATRAGAPTLRAPLPGCHSAIPPFRALSANSTFSVGAEFARAKLMESGIYLPKMDGYWRISP